MTELYLRSVELSNFRIYGDSYAYEISDGPGVTLITGGNGLGKTSFFDGVEWALTGRVGRFSDIPIDGRRKALDPLTRIGAPEGSHRVSIQFSDGSPIDRGTGFEPDEAGIAKLLKRPDWADINNLHGYLSITHFFGQASTQRFSLRKPGDQWEALKGPAGVDRINALRERLNGLGVRRAFNRAIADRTKALEEASATLIAWNSLLAERDRARQLASSDQAITPSDLRATADGFAKQLLEVVPNVVPNVNWASSLTAELPESTLHRLAMLLRTVEEINDQEDKRLQALAELVVAFESVDSETFALSKQAAETEARLLATVEQLRVADAGLIEATTVVTSSQFQADQDQSRMVTLARVAGMAKQLSDAQSRHTLIQSQLSDSYAAISHAQAKCAQLRKQLSDVTALRSERRALHERIIQTHKRAQISASRVLIRSEISRIILLLEARNQKHVRDTRAALVSSAVAANEQISVLTTDLRRHDDRLRSLAEAVSAIAHRLEHDDTACPVCTSEFPPGVLAELARSHAVANVTPATKLAATLADMRLEAESLQQRIAEADRTIIEIDQLQVSLAAQRAREDELRQQLVEAGGAADGIYYNTDASKLEHELDALDDKISTAVTPESLAVLIEEVEASLKAEAARCVSFQKSQAGASEEMQAARLTLLQHPDLWSEDHGILVDLSAEQAVAEKRSREIGERILGEQANLAKARVARDALHRIEVLEAESQAIISTRLGALASQRQELMRCWVEAGQIGEPDATQLVDYKLLAIERTNRLEQMRAGLQRLVTGFRKWLGDEQLRKLDNQVAKKLQMERAASEAEVNALFVAREQSARQELDLVQSARHKAEQIGVQMQERAMSYADDVLVPLNATIKRFARTLMTWSDASINYRAEHHTTRSELRPGITRNDVDGSTIQVEMNPHLYFSEGQLSALSVAALLAASTTFGWSRWRGLLLDDPLQHNDVIHASAFMDLLRQLVRILGYQIILSTHDSAEAEFLGRKCRSSGIPYRVHELVPRGEDGLVFAGDTVARSTPAWHG